MITAFIIGLILALCLGILIGLVTSEACPEHTDPIGCSAMIVFILTVGALIGIGLS